MRRKTLGIGAVVVLVLAAASAAGLAVLGSNASSDEIVIVRDPPGGGGCICPANWEPVVCTAPDGSHHGFSNACVAGCYGYTHCARIIVSTP
jgi:hypothetical protein